MVSRSACRGSNFLLNIGPTPQGTFPIQDQVRLRDLGAWMQKNGEAIYKTKGSPFTKEHPWGSITCSKENNVVFLHLMDWNGGDIILKGLTSTVNKASFLDSAETVPFLNNQNKTKLTLSLPQQNTLKELRIIKLELAEPIKFDLEKGPSFMAQAVFHVTSLLVKGEITSVKATTFTLSGHRKVSNKTGNEKWAEKKESFTFSLNDHVHFRINLDGKIQSVQEFKLEKGKTYKVVYSPSKKSSIVEIITEMLP
jgi:alpha-L-fucosidase